jgi:hypothetical protein
MHKFCSNCGSMLNSGDCNNCFDNKNVLREFEEEDE